MAKTFNMEMNIAKAIGIFAVVAGHTNWNIFGDFIHNYIWHLPLFFFVSGYFFKSELFEGTEIIKKFFNFMKKVVCRYLGRFYAYHFFYGGVTFLIYIWFDRLYGKLPTLKNLTLSPFDSTPFDISIPMWFLYGLTIDIILFAFIMIICKKINKNDFFPALIFLPAGVLGILLAKDNFQPSVGFSRVIIRTLLALYYMYGGYLYRHVIEQKVKFNLKTLGIILLLYLGLQIYTDGKLNISLGSSRVPQNIAPLVAPFLCIYFVLFISKLLAPLVKENSPVDKIGRNTLHIMANHLFAIFLIELLIFVVEDINFNKLPKVLLHHFYNIGKYKFLYAFGAVIICTYAGEILNFTGNKIKTKFIGWKESRFPSKAPCGQPYDALKAP